MLPKAVTDSHHKKRKSQNVAALGGGVIEGEICWAGKVVLG